MIQELYTCEIDEIAVCTNLCFANQDAANNVRLTMGVKSGGAYYPAQATAVLAAGLYKQLDNPIYIRERETLQVGFLPDGADTDWSVWAEIHVFLIEHTKT